MTTKMSAEDLIRKQAEAWNAHDSARVVAFYTENATVLDPAYPEPLSGRAAIAKDADDFFAALPDLKYRPTKIISDGDTICVEGIGNGTHTGPLQLLTGVVPATNRSVEFSIAIVQDMDAMGNIREERRYYDVAGVLAQLGLMQ